MHAIPLAGEELDLGQQFVESRISGPPAAVKGGEELLVRVLLAHEIVKVAEFGFEHRLPHLTFIGLHVAAQLLPGLGINVAVRPEPVEDGEVGQRSADCPDKLQLL